MTEAELRELVEELRTEERKLPIDSAARAELRAQRRAAEDALIALS